MRKNPDKRVYFRSLLRKVQQTPSLEPKGERFEGNSKRMGELAVVKKPAKMFRIR
jgi:hypothetical protein